MRTLLDKNTFSSSSNGQVTAHRVTGLIVKLGFIYIDAASSYPRASQKHIARFVYIRVHSSPAPNPPKKPNTTRVRAKHVWQLTSPLNISCPGALIVLHPALPLSPPLVDCPTSVVNPTSYLLATSEASSSPRSGFSTGVAYVCGISFDALRQYFSGTGFTIERVSLNLTSRWSHEAIWSSGE